MLVCSIVLIVLLVVSAVVVDCVDSIKIDVDVSDSHDPSVVSDDVYSVVVPGVVSILGVCENKELVS